VSRFIFHHSNLTVRNYSDFTLERQLPKRGVSSPTLAICKSVGAAGCDRLTTSWIRRPHGLVYRGTMLEKQRSRTFRLTRCGDSFLENLFRQVQIAGNLVTPFGAVGTGLVEHSVVLCVNSSIFEPNGFFTAMMAVRRAS